VRRRADKMLRALALGGVELSVALVDDETMRELNFRYRGKDRPTDVLAFAMREGEGGGGDVLGDVIIAVEVARRQAAKRRLPVGDEVTMLLAHGLLHLLGFDHATKAEERVMKARTAELVAAARAR
jgi:probable rRNA maturation factor